MKKNNKQNRGNPAKVAVDGLVHTDEHNSDTGLVHIGVHNTLHINVDGLVHIGVHNTVHINVYDLVHIGVRNTLHINVYDLVHIGVRNTVHINDFAAQGAQQHFSVGVKTVGSNKKHNMGKCRETILNQRQSLVELTWSSNQMC